MDKMGKIDKDIIKEFDEKIKSINKEDSDSDFDEKDEKQLDNIDFYAVLNIPRNATTDEIKIAYKKLAFTYHPDKQSNEELKKETQELFTLITMAKDTLSDPKLRAIYDKFGIEGLENSKAIVNKYIEVDRVLKALDRIQKEAEEEKLIDSFSATGSQTIQFAYHHDYNFFFFKNLNSRAIFNIKSKKLGNFEIIPSINRKKNHSWFGLVTSYGYSINSNTELFVSNEYREISGGIKPSIGIKRMITQDCLGSIVCSIDNGSLERGTFILTKTLTPSLQGTFRGTIEREHQTISVSLKRMIQKRIFELSLDYSTLLGLNAAIYRTIPVSKKTKVLVSVGCDHGLQAWNDYNEAKLMFTLNRRVSRVFEIDLTMQVSSSRYLYILGLHHRYQSLEIPLPIYADINWKASLLFFTIPSVIYALTKQFLIKPLTKKKEERKIKEKKEKYAEQSRKSKRKAEMDILLVRSAVENKILKEKTKNGLIIQEALYGKINEKLDNSDPYNIEFPPYVDVTIPLQYLVEESKLELHSNNKKSDLLGFWDPRIGEEKQLKVTYFFQNRLHKVIVNDNDQLLIPLKCNV